MRFLLITPICLLLTQLLFSSVAVANAFFAELAFQHAPIHYQDTDNSDYSAEYISAFNFDGDWNGSNNWDNEPGRLKRAAVYYSVVESCDYYFINYGFFHPRDWSDVIFDQEHENDLEGVILLVEKNASTFGRAVAMVTVFHRDFYSYARAGSGLTSGEESIDGDMAFQTEQNISRVKTAQEAKGHGIKAWPQIRNFTGQSNQDGIIYFPSKTQSEEPSSGNDRQVSYRLIPYREAGGLWERALAEANSGQRYTYQNWGTFRGDRSGGCGSGWKLCGSNSANTPWGWDDKDDGESYRGEFALDPAHLFEHYFNGLKPGNDRYVTNFYLDDLLASGFSESNRPSGFTEQLNLDALFAKRGATCAAGNF